MPELRPIPRLLAIAVAALALVPDAALACRCLARSPAAAARTADVVVLADVEPGVGTSGQATSYRVKIVESWKHRLIGKLVVLTERTDCAAELTAGHRYLLYLQRTAQGYSTQACAGNRPAEQAASAIAGLRRNYR